MRKHTVKINVAQRNGHREQGLIPGETMDGIGIHEHGEEEDRNDEA